MLSELPKLADKAFIIGFLLPTLLFILALAALFSDFPWVRDTFDAAINPDGWEKIAFLVLILWLASVLLMACNFVQFQILEGYRWPISKIAFLARRERRRYNALLADFNALDLRHSQGLASPDEEQRRSELKQELVQKFPANESALLPTRFGNAIRAFETYSKEVYGVDSIPMWLHLSTVISKEFQPAIDDSRAQVNFLVNISFLAALVAVIAVGRFVYSIEWALVSSLPTPGVAWDAARYSANLWFAAAAVGAGIVSWMAYRFSIELVYAWGGLVKAAFDCYLPALAEKLGYKLGKTDDEQREFWTAVSIRAIYHIPLDPSAWPRTGGDKPALPPKLRVDLRKLR